MNGCFALRSGTPRSAIMYSGKRPNAEIGLLSPVFQSPGQPLLQIKRELMIKSTQLGFNPTFLSANYKSVIEATLFG
jgi:hypothetical protein